MQEEHLTYQNAQKKLHENCCYSMWVTMVTMMSKSESTKNFFETMAVYLQSIFLALQRNRVQKYIYKD